MKGMIDALFRIDWPGVAVPMISILEKIIRPLIIYLFLVIALRIAGKREMAQINTFDFVVLLLLSNTVQNAIIGNDTSVSGGIIGSISLLVINFVVVKFLFKHQKFEGVFEGKPELLIVDGIINKKLLAKELITEAELETAAHKQGIESISDIKSAELDPDGALFFVQKTPPPEQARHIEIMRRLDALSDELRNMRTEMNGK
jgi:uncharacterized membrane protein YcaP (DUF421 family)